MNANLRRRRRGVTLVEMLVTLAVLLLMMALVVQIFQAATGSMNAAQVYQRLDDDLRRLDSTLRSDLAGATAKFTPPNDPKDQRGYFEYGENEYADNDGEDIDDYIRLTVKAPAGRPFTGRMWAKPANVLTTTLYMDLLTPAERSASRPITVTSEYAEVIYFLRNGNLYRRVLLVAPELQSRIVPSFSEVAAATWNLGYYVASTSSGAPTFPWAFFPPDLGGLQVSWQGVNDLSARPAARGLPSTNGANNSVVLNSLADLTDRHNRFAMPRFADDFVNLAGGLIPDGIPDDFNGDNVPDWYPTLYPNMIEDSVAGGSTTRVLWNVFNRPAITGNGNLYPRRYSLAFPYVFRGAYSQAQALANYSPGWIHAPAPWATNGDGTTIYQFDTDPINYLLNLNHNPLDLGDNAPAPTVTGQNWSNLQTLWQFPTWRETLAPEWNDPTFQVNQPGVGHAFPNGLLPSNAIPANAGETLSGHVERGANIAGNQLLPPMTADWRGVRKAQLFTDGTGANSGYFAGDPTNPLWADNSWEDDLILTNVRSFDVKAFDPALADYADLGWGDDLRIAGPATSVGANPSLGTNENLPYLYGNFDAFAGAFGPNAYALINGSAYNVLDQTFAHEGRMPPLINDYRFDSQYGAVAAGFYGSTYPTYDGNIGDNAPGLIRLRRVWDSWSTTYSKAPATGVRAIDGFPHGPPFSPPIYPSYPAPYPAPLRGIQVQVRVADPTNQRIKILTIRQDFTEKL
ncbi:prepilin-type N-terminal cleavage/methylation domain-containing protein [Paludisphaera soli]|uniref:prepilin-type N-terminal cleavage/methylation domain-containing protein n=1 Tax=Paludisphaera soli TaxID=2712865 RepID=UPI0013EA9F39|nr:prepilin-type N-terminal cleavage/methylation domain-containing protein [Paludisphaera soli]